MKHRPKLFTSLVGSALLAACSATPPAPEVSVVPFSQIRDGADSADNFYALGRELQRSGKFDDAERAYRRALEIEPAHVDAHNGLAAISVSRGDVDHAIAILTKLAAQGPDQAHLQGNLGYAHYLKGNYAQARVALEHAVTLDPSNQRLQEKLTLVLQKLGVQADPVPLAQLDENTGGAVAAEAQAGNLPARDRIVELSPGVHVLQRAEAPPLVVAQAPASQVRSLLPEKTSTARAAETDIVAEPGRDGRVEIVNGNGVAGLARSVHQRVQAQGAWQVVRIGNQPKFNVQLTRIEFAPGNRQAARELARQLRIAPVYWHNDALGNRVRVVLGHDLRLRDLPRTQPAQATLDGQDSAG